MTATLVALSDIEAAAVRIRDVAVRTPLIEVAVEHGGHSTSPVTIGLKCENLQPMGAFKIRGAYNMIASLVAGSSFRRRHYVFFG